jgi:thioredoxin 2
MNTLMVCPGCGAKNRVPAEKQHLSPKCGRCGLSLVGAPVSGLVNPLVDAQFHQRVEQSSMPVLLDFYSPTCGPCRMIAPVLETLAKEYAGRLLVFKLDTSSQQMTPARFQIRGDHPAWAAGGRVKIEQHRHGRLLHPLMELGVNQRIDQPGNRRANQRQPATSAFGGEMLFFRRDPVLGPASGANHQRIHCARSLQDAIKSETQGKSGCGRLVREASW